MPSLVALGIDDLAEAKEWVRAYFDHDGLEFGPHVAAGIAELLGDGALGRFWVIESDGSRVGYVVLTFGFDHEFGGRIGLVSDFYLRDYARCAGVGTRVFGQVIEEAKRMKLKAIELYVLDHNERAMNFYRRFGFAPTADRAPLHLELSP